MVNGNGGVAAAADQDVETVEAELVPLTDSIALTADDRAQIDIQIATAKKYPRDVAKSVREAKLLACMDEDVAASMHYALPRKQDGEKVFITGPTIRFAEIIAYSWQNLRFEKRIVSIDEKYVTAQATVMDLERNIGGRAEVKRRITYSDRGNRKGGRYSEDMIQQTGNAAASIALRNALFAVVPPALTKSVESAAKQLATGGAQPIEARRQKALAWFAKVGADQARVLNLLGVKTVDEITQEDLETLTGLKTSIQDGNITVEEAFDNPSEAQAAHATRESLENLKERIADKKQEQQKPASTDGPATPDSKEDKAKVAAHRLLTDSLGRHGFELDEPRVASWLNYLVGKRAVAELTAKEVTKAVKALETGDLPKDAAP